MHFIIYALFYPILWIVSILPFPIFYLFSDAIYFIVYYLIGYRKKIVRYNLSITFPHLSSKERLVIEKKFYSHMCDLFLEMIKTMSISKLEMEKRFVITNIDLLKEYELKGKSVILLASHYASWEWLLSINDKTLFKGIGVYKKIDNPYFDKLVKKIRSKFGTELITTSDTIRTIEENEKNGVLAIYGFASDQSPMLNRAFYWRKFMGIEVPIHTGAEMIVRKQDLNVLFISVKKVKRGYYEATFVPIAENPRLLSDYAITDLFIDEVEKQIFEAPEYYFWTHKRWKHRR